MENILIVLTAFIVSAFGSIVGFGGGVFMIPILVIIFGLPIKLAVGSVIIALIPATAISSIFNIKNSSIDYVAALILEIPTILGTVLGAYLNTILPINVVEFLFSFILMIIGLSTIKKAKVNISKRNRKNFLYTINNIGGALIRRHKYGAYKINYLLGFLFGLISGITAGFLGIGGGFLKVPIMINVFRMPVIVASSTALFMIFFTSLTGSISHFALGNINLSSSIPVIIGFALGAVTGNLLNTKFTETRLKIFVGGGLILASLSILFNWFLN